MKIAIALLFLGQVWFAVDIFLKLDATRRHNNLHNLVAEQMAKVDCINHTGRANHHERFTKFLQACKNLLLLGEWRVAHEDVSTIVSEEINGLVNHITTEFGEVFATLP